MRSTVATPGLPLQGSRASQTRADPLLERCAALQILVEMAILEVDLLEGQQTSLPEH